MISMPLNQQNLIFSLDIGTRNVVGSIAEKVEDTYIVHDYEIMEHPDRAMLDGQIHDIDKVTRVVEKVKAALEERNEIHLKQVAIAAAGRALKTQSIHVERTLDYTQEIEKSMMDSVEMEGIQLAQHKLGETDPLAETRYYCVGYSVINYYLDGSMIINPKGHRGAVLSAEIIATFLPHIVVDSLYTVMSRAELEVISLTLEPIAAINIAIPQKLRLLNLALVDVGAGTSDIAITKDGSIVSYGMVDMAGDEITEVLAREFLLDFDAAENLKLRLMKEEQLSFSDIVGIPYNMHRDEILSRIEGTIDKITNSISERIHEVNDRPPSAIFCIGGGCQVPGFTEKLAKALELPKERVVIKGTEMLENVEFRPDPLHGPEYITPLGIGFTAFNDKEHDFLQVSVNEKPIRLFNSKQLTVSDALILVGFNARKLLAERGESFQVVLNEERRTVLGDYGEPARIFINGAPASLDTRLRNKDAIHIQPAVPGKKREMQLDELVDMHAKIRVNGHEIIMVRGVRVNGELKNEKYILATNDQVEVIDIKTVADLAAHLDLTTELIGFEVNGKSVSEDWLLKRNDEVNWIRKTRDSRDMLTVEDVVDEIDMNRDEAVAEGIIAMDEQDDAQADEAVSQPVSEEPVVQTYYFSVNGKQIEVSNTKSMMVFVDIFEHIDFDISTPKGILDLKLNGVRARYTDVLKSGDVIEIGWR